VFTSAEVDLQQLHAVLFQISKVYTAGIIELNNGDVLKEVFIKTAKPEPNGATCSCSQGRCK
jgi:hypothetical protein